MKLLTKPVNIAEVRMEEGNIFFNDTQHNCFMVTMVSGQNEIGEEGRKCSE